MNKQIEELNMKVEKLEKVLIKLLVETNRTSIVRKKMIEDTESKFGEICKFIYYKFNTEIPTDILSEKKLNGERFLYLYDSECFQDLQ